MAEKNTTSILEAIKNKLHKFDQKPEKSSGIANVESEFEYISPLSKAAKAMPTPPSSSNAGGMEDFSKGHVAAKTVPVAPASIPDHSASEEDFMFDTAKSNASTPKTSGAVMSEGDIEEYEVELEADNTKKPEVKKSDDLDFDLDFHDEHEVAQQPVAAQNVAPKQSSEPTMDDLDLNFDDDHAVSPAPKQSDQRLAASVPPTPLQQPVAAQEHHEDDDLNFDDLDLHDQPEEKPAAPVPAAKTAAEEHHDDLDFDNFDFDESKATEAKPAAPAIPVEHHEEEHHEEEHHDEFHDDDHNHEEEHHEEIQAVSSLPAVPASITPSLSKSNELSLEELEGDHLGLDQDHLEDHHKEHHDEEHHLDQDEDDLNLDDHHHSLPTMSQRQPLMVNDITIKQTSESIKKLLDAKNMVSTISNFSKSPEIEKIAIQIMEPKLEQWLNENLPSIVDRVVREEIKKIVG